MRRTHKAELADTFSYQTTTNPPNHGVILTNATITKAVMASAAEAELGALFLNAKEAVFLRRQVLTKTGHPKPRIPIQTDNITAEGMVNNKIQPKRTKAMGMRFHWLCNRKAQGQFRIYWQPGNTNLLDYSTSAPCEHQSSRIFDKGKRSGRCMMPEDE